MTAKSRQFIYNERKIKTALLLNPQSGSVKKRLTKVRRLILKLNVADTCETTTPEQINKAINVFVRNQIELLVIIGGDGTAQAVFNHYFSNAEKTELPFILIIPGGTTNMTARDLGVKGGLMKNLYRLNNMINNGHAGTMVHRAILRIAPDNMAPMYGMFFGAGIIASGTKYFHNHIRRTGITGEFASFIVVLNFIVKLITGRRPGDFNPVCLQFMDDKTDFKNPDCLLVLASTLDRLLFGLKPYWGTELAPVHFTCIRNKPVNFLSALISIIFNRGNTLLKSNGYYSSNNKHLELQFNSHFIVDGELFHTGGDNRPVHITSTPPVKFIVP